MTSFKSNWFFRKGSDKCSSQFNPVSLIYKLMFLFYNCVLLLFTWQIRAPQIHTFKLEIPAPSAKALTLSWFRKVVMLMENIHSSVHQSGRLSHITTVMSLDDLQGRCMELVVDCWWSRRSSRWSRWSRVVQGGPGSLPSPQPACCSLAWRSAVMETGI